MDRFMTIMRKEFIHISRDARTLALILLLPALLLVLLGYGVSGESSNIPFAVVDYSRTSTSQEYIDKYTASGDFELVIMPLSENELLNLIDRDEVDIGLLIPEDFGRKVDTGEPVTVQLYVNGSTEPSEAQTIQLKISAISQAATQEILVNQIKRSPEFAKGLSMPIDTSIKTLYNPDGDSGIYMIPGLIPILLQVQALLLSALAIVREREQGTMEQLIVTPLAKWELMLGKIAPYLIVSIFNTIVLLWLGELVFHVSVIGNFLELIFLSIIFIIGSLGLGVLISNISQSQMQAMYITMFVVLIPAIILSGLLFPRDTMPPFTFWFGEFLPITHYLEITRGIMIRGIGSEFLWPSIIPLILLSVLYFTAAVLAFRKRI
ncbi:MAG: ABC transporter permease [Anaerolineales bacterium]|jgi:ABC-2 type transport system permease protein